MASKDIAEFIHVPAPDHPGWYTWHLADETRFQPVVMGPMLVRPEEGNTARVRMFPQVHHSNARGSIHGGVTMALIDIALFATLATLVGGDAPRSMTLDLNSQFVGAGQLGSPIDAVSEILRETGRLVFLRGKVQQDGALIAAYSATIRKPSKSQ